MRVRGAAFILCGVLAASMAASACTLSRTFPADSERYSFLVDVAGDAVRNSYFNFPWTGSGGDAGLGSDLTVSAADTSPGSFDAGYDTPVATLGFDTLSFDSLDSYGIGELAVSPAVISPGDWPPWGSVSTAEAIVMNSISTTSFTKFRAANP